jgi:hypothetical protein
LAARMENRSHSLDQSRLEGSLRGSDSMSAGISSLIACSGVKAAIALSSDSFFEEDGCAGQART